MLEIKATEQFGMYQIELTHAGLNRYRVFKGRDRYVVVQKAESQQAVWEEQWAKKEAKLRSQEATQLNAERAQDLTREAKDAIEKVQRLLSEAIQCNHAVNWERLKDHTPFSVAAPIPPAGFELGPSLAAPRKPLPSDAAYVVKTGFLAKLFPEIRDKAEEKAAEKYKQDLAAWEVECRKRGDAAKIKRAAYDTGVKKYDAALKEWEAKRQTHLGDQKRKNALVDSRRVAYLAGRQAAIEDYCDTVLSNSEYPDYFPQDYEIGYIEGSRTLVVDYQLPEPDRFPRVKEVRFVKSRGEFQEIPFKDSERQKLYDETIYKVLLRTLHELFNADVIKRIDSIGFNGWVSSVDRSTGKTAHACIVSIHVQRSEFMGINLAEVDPKACFRRLKGVGSSQLHSVTPVPPVMSQNTNDKRFVQSHEVGDKLAEGSNLAAMDWEEFEHLVREVFEKEFAKDGAEVKVTRASRDGGVDAVVFNPDPLRGGKIVIQAKRYVNTVGVSAVRDLYGTLMNEGAGKGILVTTADYGPDAYEFIKGKPLVLINGSQLLYLLQQNGYKGRIDLAEARKLEQVQRSVGSTG